MSRTVGNKMSMEEHPFNTAKEKKRRMRECRRKNGQAQKILEILTKEKDELDSRLYINL